MKYLRIIGLLSLLFFAVACDDDGGVTGPTSPPAAPSVQAAFSGQTVTVTWNEVDETDDYRAVLTTSGEADREDETSETSVIFSDLSPGTTYFVQVFARNSAGVSQPGTATGETAVEEDPFVLVTNDILEDTQWTSDKVWILTQPIFVGRDCGPEGADPDCEPATLTIEPGTTVVGRTDIPQGVRGAYLIVSRGSRLVADATQGEDRRPTADEVIVFTSDRPRGERAVADWGGLIVNGQAPTNAGAEAEGEGDSGFYGGPDDEDDSGILRGVRIEYAGDDVTPADQLNGLALQGVGAGTTISYVQIHYNKDDGIEPFGGTVSVDHLVVTGIGDDSVDGTDGYRGFMQFVLGQQDGQDADNGFEISNNGDTEDAEPKSTAVIANATMIGAGNAVVDGEIAGAESDNGIQLREGTNYRVYNSIFQGFGESGFCIRDAQSIVNAQNRLAGDDDPQSTLSAEGLIMWSNQVEGASDDNFAACGGGSTQAFNQEFYEEPGFNNMMADPGFDTSSIYNFGTLTDPPNFTLADMPSGYTAATLPDFDGVNLVAPLDGRQLIQTDYAGAVAPGTAAEDAWYYGWTIWTQNGSDSRPNHEGN